MNRFQKILTGSVIALIIINIALLGFIWSHRPDRSEGGKSHRPEISGHFLLDRLDVTPEQKAKFAKELRAHRDRMDTLGEVVRLRKHEVTQAIILGDSSRLSQLNQELFEAQKMMELESQRLTANLASLCDNEQRQKYLQLMGNILRRDHGHPLRPRKGHR